MSEIKSVRRCEEFYFYRIARWMSWLFMAGSILLLLSTCYKAEIIHQGEQSARYFKYYVIFLTGVLFWGAVLRLKEEVRANVVTVAVTLVVGLYLVEGAIHFLSFMQKPERVAAAAKLGIKYDKRTKLDVVEDLIAEGVDAVPMLSPAVFLHQGGLHKDDDMPWFPLGGVSNKTTVSANENGKWSIYTSDRYGFNNPDFEWDSQQIDWLLTGDSFTHGLAVRPGEDIAGQVRFITNDSAINVGCAGNGPLFELAVLKEYAEHVRPKKVLWIYYEENDLIDDLQNEKEIPLLMNYLQDDFSQNLINQQQEINSSLTEYIAQAKVQAVPYKTGWMRLEAVRKLISFDVEGEIDVNPLFAKVLTKAKARTAAWGGELYFVYLPEWSRYSGLTADHDQYRKKSVVIDVIKNLNIPVIDIHQGVFADHPDPLSLFPFRMNGHYNAEGYSEVAKAIIANIKE